MSGNLKTYIISGKIVCLAKVLSVNKATVKNCYTDLQAKVKFEQACKKKYREFVRCEILSCYLDIASVGASDILNNFKDIFGQPYND